MAGRIINSENEGGEANEYAGKDVHQHPDQVDESEGTNEGIPHVSEWSIQRGGYNHHTADRGTADHSILGQTEGVDNGYHGSDLWPQFYILKVTGIGRAGKEEDNRMAKRREEQGSVEVEAMILLPVAVLSTVMLLYLSLFLFQRASLQACLETSLVYYKNTVTDTYVTRAKRVSYTNRGGSLVGAGSIYSALSPLNPYRGIFGGSSGFGAADFEQYFRSAAGNMLFRDNLELTIDFSDYVLLKQFQVTAVQKVSFPIDLSILGSEREYRISATARVAVADHDSTIRNVDYAIDLLEDTKLGKIAGNLASKIAEAYGKLKMFLE